MRETTINYGLDATEIIVRISPANKKAFEAHNKLSISEVQRELEGKELTCHFQRIEEGEHFVTVPLMEGHLLIAVKVHGMTGTYQVVMGDNKRKTRFQTGPSEPVINSLEEQCRLRIIDLSSKGRENRASDELDLLTARVQQLPITPLVDVSNQQQIWIKFIEAQHAIVKSLERPFDTHGLPKVDEKNDEQGKVIRYDIQFDLGEGPVPELEQLSNRLKTLKITRKIQQDNSVLLSRAELEVLDRLLEEEFAGALTRGKILGCILRVQTLSLAREIDEQLPNGVRVSQNPARMELRILNGDGPMIHALLRNYGFEFVRMEQDGKGNQESVFRVKKGKSVDFHEGDFSEQFWGHFERRILEEKLNFSLNPRSRTIFLDFLTESELKTQIEGLHQLKMVALAFSPLRDDFRFKVKLQPTAGKTELELLEERMDKLRGVDFVLEVPTPDQKPDVRLPLGTFQRRKSNFQTLQLSFACAKTQERKEAERTILFLKNKLKTRRFWVKPDLTGDRVKLEWLEKAMRKITDPTHAPNGAPVNPKLGKFLYNSSLAQPIFDEAKMKEGASEYAEMKQYELLQLNPSQRKAVLAAIHCTDLGLVQGPPGTGKTTVIAEMIWQMIRKNPKHRVLLTSETNLAVDNALDRLLNEKNVNPELTRLMTLIKPLRFGRVEKMDEEGARYAVRRIRKWAFPNEQTIEEELAGVLDGDENEKENKGTLLENNAVQNWMKRIAARARHQDPRYGEVLKSWTWDLNSPEAEMKQVFAKKYLKHANIVGSTCSSAGSPNFMWEYASSIAGIETNELRKQYFHAERVPFGRTFDQVLKKAGPASAAVQEYRQLKKAFEQEKQALRRHFKSNKEGLTAVPLSAEHFPTIDGQDLFSDKDSDRLQSFAVLLDHSRRHIAPFAESRVVFDTVIMDEASKATPPEMLVPLTLGKRSIVIGDHRQLPPMLNNKEFREVLAEAGAQHLVEEIDAEFTGTSQFERMILNPAVPPSIISRCNIQYRMHPHINNVIRQFYLDEGGLEPAPELRMQADSPNLADPFSRYHGLSLPGFIEPDLHTIWVNVKTPEKREGTSMTNQGEVEAVSKVLQLLNQAAGFSKFQTHWNSVRDEFKRQQEKEIGVISFYGAQKRLLKKGLNATGLPLKINTVDRFQGMERNIVIVSTVRSHEQEQVDGLVKPNSDSGFAKAPQRLNVALSRARRLLIVVGNKDFFRQVRDQKGNFLYKNAIAEIEKAGRILDFETLQPLLK